MKIFYRNKKKANINNNNKRQMVGVFAILNIKGLISLSYKGLLKLRRKTAKPRKMGIKYDHAVYRKKDTNDC